MNRHLFRRFAGFTPVTLLTLAYASCHIYARHSGARSFVWETSASNPIARVVFLDAGISQNHNGHSMSGLETTNGWLTCVGPRASPSRANSKKLSVTNFTFLHLFIRLQKRRPNNWRCSFQLEREKGKTP